MNLSFSYIPLRWMHIILLCLVYMLLQAAALQPLVASPFPLLLLKGAADALVLAAIGGLLAVAVPSSNYVRLGAMQRLANFFALGLVVVPAWVALFFLSSLLVFGGDALAGIIRLLPLAAFIGIFAYVALLQAILYRMAAAEKEDDGGLPEGENVVQAPTAGNAKGQENAGTLERVAVKTGQKIHVILVPDIVYIRSDGDYVQIVTGSDKFLKEETMKYFEAGLPPSQFVRVHRSYIVNVGKILRIEMYEKQNQMLTLTNGDRIRASVSGYKALRAALNL